MTLMIDNGTFAVGNSFVTLSEADEYHNIRQNTDWFDKTNAQREAALIKAFDFLSVQNWTTTAFSSGVPAKIKSAQCIGALKEATSPDALQPDISSSVKKESIDGVMETEYFEGSGSAAIITAVENMIRPYIKKPGMRMTMVRG